MPMEKIDVCIVTRDGKRPIGLENIPIEQLIFNDERPIGVARKRCIQNVKTSIFAFIDDDMIVDKYWYNMLSIFMEDKTVGAVWGTTIGKGFGWFSKYSYDSIGLKELKYGERFNTNNCLIRTELVKDWVPSYGVNCYEDLDLENHIMNKGYKVLFVPSTVIHYKGWKELKRSALWAGYRFKEAYPNVSIVREYLRRMISPFKSIIFRGIPHSIYVFYRNYWFMIGMMKRDLEEMSK